LGHGVTDVAAQAQKNDSKMSLQQTARHRSKRMRRRGRWNQGVGLSFKENEMLLVAVTTLPVDQTLS